MDIKLTEISREDFEDVIELELEAAQEKHWATASLNA